MVLGGLVYLFATNQNNTEPESENSSPVDIVNIGATPESNPEGGDVQNPQGITISQIFTVTYTDEGYSPKDLTIDIGDTVEFENSSSRPVWIIAGDDLAAQFLPELNAEKNYNPGETYSFTFDKSGVWTYRNKLEPSEAGTITVK